MILTTLTEREKDLVLAGGILGMFFAIIAVAFITMIVLKVVAGWKIFTKAGYAGWKSIIPVYSEYITFKIAKVGFWIWFVLPIVAYIIFASIAGPNPEKANAFVQILLFASCIYVIIGGIKLVKGLAKSFGKGIGFAVGLFFFPNIFQLILGFGKAKYKK